MRSRRLDRRTVLRGAGVALALPFLDCMAEAKSKQEAPRRFCSFYFPYGVSLPDKDSEHAQWRWFPEGGERDYRFTKTLEVLEPLRDDITIFEGLSHPQCRDMGAHDTADTFLTGSKLVGKFLRNTVSVDQVIAASIGHRTRYPSLVLSTDGGVGERRAPARCRSVRTDTRSPP